MMLMWINISGSDVVYPEGGISGCGWQSEKRCFGATFDLAKKSESLFSRISATNQNAM
jgi:hypothetical protein